MDEINLVALPSWLKTAVTVTLKRQGKAAAIALCRRYMYDGIGCEIAVADILKTLK